MLERLPEHLSKAFLPHPPRIMGVAVSGGSDSLALLYLLHEFCELHQIELHAVTVDHGLRDEAAGEAASVAAHCETIGVAHHTLVWENWDGKGNLQSAAREMRYRKMADWAVDHDINTIAVAHTADDQAETVLMRMARSAGVDGLSGMQPRTLRNGITWVRPLLKTRRKSLQTYLRNQNVDWVSDPSNDDERYDRIKARRALQLLSELGINQEVLAEVADHLSQARKALDWQTFLAAKDIVRIEAGAVMIDGTGLRLQPDEIQRRLLVAAIKWVGGSAYPARRAAVLDAIDAVQKGQARTLDGCHMRRIAAKIWVFREYNAVVDLSVPSDQDWDARWRMLPFPPAAHSPDLCLRALGPAGLDQCPDWRVTGRPHVVLQSTPAIWQGDTLVSAPLAGFDQNWYADPIGGRDAFFATLISH